jgi:hypothetical protein
MMIQRRLRESAEERIRATQYGFRPKRGTSQALAIVRRIFDAAASNSSPGLLALILDWAKAFDRLKIDALLSALERFGIPGPLLEMIASIYRIRYFIILDERQQSTQRQQRAGIAQGCPLSPYLFILVQTVLLHDVDQRLAAAQGANPHIEPPYVVCTDVLYADDTILFSSSAQKLQTHVHLIVDEGQRYGLESNWGKTVAININNDGGLIQPSGEQVARVNQAVYLGGLISSNTEVSAEISRRLGEARGGVRRIAEMLVARKHQPTKEDTIVLCVRGIQGGMWLGISLAIAAPLSPH